MRMHVVRAAMITALMPVVAGAQSLVLTESEALARLSTENPRVYALRTSVNVARADVLAASRWPNPRATVNRESTVGITEYISTIGQLLPVTGRRGLDVSAASAHVDAVSSRADDDTRRLRADVRLAYAELVAAQSRENELRVAVLRARELADIVGKRETAGDAAGFDKLRAEREALDRDADSATFRVARGQAQALLAGYFVNTPSASIVAVAPGTARGPLPSLDELIARAESTRGELRALQQDAVSAEFAERAAERSRFPEPEIVAGTKSSSAGAGDIGGVFAVHATLPLFDRAHPERAHARARVAQARAHADVFRIALHMQIGALRAAVSERREAADRYRAAEGANAELERIAQVSYDAGETGILQLLDAHRTGAAARLRQIELDLAARRAEIELEFVSGWEMPL